MIPYFNISHLRKKRQAQESEPLYFNFWDSTSSVNVKEQEIETEAPFYHYHLEIDISIADADGEFGCGMLGDVVRTKDSRTMGGWYVASPKKLLLWKRYIDGFWKAPTSKLRTIKERRSHLNVDEEGIMKFTNMKNPFTRLPDDILYILEDRAGTSISRKIIDDWIAAASDRTYYEWDKEFGATKTTYLNPDSYDGLAYRINGYEDITLKGSIYLPIKIDPFHHIGFDAESFVEVCGKNMELILDMKLSEV